MHDRVIVEVAPEELAPPMPPTLEVRAKSFFKRTNGVPQVTMCLKKKRIHSYLLGAHNQLHVITPMPSRYRKGTAAATALLNTIKSGINLFDGAFHIRHNVLNFSRYYTLSIIEEEENTKANLAIVGEIRALMGMADITTYDLSAKTAQRRGISMQKSVDIGSNIFLKKDHRATK
jgi:hypothetical protein